MATEYKQRFPSYSLAPGLKDTMGRRINHLRWCVSLVKRNLREWHKGQKIRCIRDFEAPETWTEPHSPEVKQAIKQYTRFRDCQTKDMPASEMVMTASYIDTLPHGRQGGVPASQWNMRDQFARPPATDRELHMYEDIAPPTTAEGEKLLAQAKVREQLSGRIDSFFQP